MARRIATEQAISDADLEHRLHRTGLRLIQFRMGRGPALDRRENPELTAIWEQFEARERAFGWTKPLERVEAREQAVEALEDCGATLARTISFEELKAMQPELRHR